MNICIALYLLSATVHPPYLLGPDTGSQLKCRHGVAIVAARVAATVPSVLCADCRRTRAIISRVSAPRTLLCAHSRNSEVINKKIVERRLCNH